MPPFRRASISHRASVSRRTFVTSSLTVASLAAAVPLAGCGEDKDAVDVKELMKPGPLPEMALGKADASVTIVEYSSLGCPHCAAWDEEVFPYMKKTYIDTGKVRFISRDFPLDAIATAAAMLARCAPADKYFDMTGLFFKTQDSWHIPQNSKDALFALSKQAGFTTESFETCLKDQKLLDDITAIRKRATDVFKVDATPTFFINGKKPERFYTPADVDKVLGSLVKS